MINRWLWLIFFPFGSIGSSQEQNGCFVVPAICNVASKSTELVFGSNLDQCIDLAKETYKLCNNTKLNDTILVVETGDLRTHVFPAISGHQSS